MRLKYKVGDIIRLTKDSDPVRCECVSHKTSRWVITSVDEDEEDDLPYLVKLEDGIDDYWIRVDEVKRKWSIIYLGGE